jgi:hypothetical protein
VPKIIFDPEIYYIIINEICKHTRQTSLNLYTLIFLNSFYMNEFLDRDVEWMDETESEQKTRVETRMRKMIEIGCEIVKLTQRSLVMGAGEPRQIQPTEPPKCSKPCAQPSPAQAEECCLYDIIDSSEPDDNDEMVKKMNKFNSEMAQKNSEKSVKFI